MQIFFDNIIFKLQNAGGISTYWAELSKRLIRDKIDVFFIEHTDKNVSSTNLKISKNLMIPGFKKPILLTRFLTIKLSDVKNKFIFHSSYNRIAVNSNAIQVLTVHDFVHEKYYRNIRGWLHTYQKNKAIAAARKIITVSNNTKKDLIELHPHIHPAKIEVIYNGVSDDFFVIDKHKLTKSENSYLIFIGSREPYKNFDFVVNLLKEMPEYDLYIVGRPFSSKEKLMLQSISHRCKLMSNVDNAQLNILYNNATALLYPSYYEGFGIPILEAMKAGLPFIALNQSSIPEVAGDAGELVPDLDLSLFKLAINKIESNRQLYVLKGLHRAKLFSWEKCYQETLSVYRNLIKE